MAALPDHREAATVMITRPVLAATAFAISSGQTQAIKDVTINELIRERVSSGANPAIVVGVVQDGQARTFAHGKGGAANGQLDGNTIFEIGSLTKVFTSAILADMVRKGEVALDDPVEKHLPASVRVPMRGRKITLLDLSVQHSGLPRLPGNLVPRDIDNPYADYTSELMFEFLATCRLTRDVGAQFEYSNLGVGLLGEALSRRAGMSYEQLVTNRVLRPLGMSDTRITLTPYMKRRLAAGHDQHGHVAANWDVRGIPAAGALRSSANDMLKFAAAALANDGPLGPAFTLAEQPRRTLAAAQRIGLNWLISQAGPIEIVWHNGGTGGHRSYLGLDRRNQRAVVVLTNSANGADDIGQRILVDAAAASSGD